MKQYKLSPVLSSDRFDYANAVLVGMLIKNIRLQCIQNIVAQIVNRVLWQQTWDLDSVQLFSSLHWLPVQLKIDFKITTISYKLLSTRQPYYQLDRITLHAPGCRLRSTGMLFISRIKTAVGECAYRSAALSVWNKRQHNVCNAPSLLPFTVN